MPRKKHNPPPPPRAIMTCVGYDDILGLTLPHTLAHFPETMVVTSKADKATQRLASRLGAIVHVTDSFYTGGSEFAKGVALEEGLDAFGREGWMSIMDCDVILPPDIEQWITNLDPTCLYAPRRRQLDDPSLYYPGMPWDHLPDAGDRELAGYCQIFHASAPVLRGRPWYGAWRHAGGCDSEFMFRWPAHKRVWLPTFVLHLGPHGKNWCGRVTPRLDGTVPKEAESRRKALAWYQSQRPFHGYEKEKL